MGKQFQTESAVCLFDDLELAAVAGTESSIGSCHGVQVDLGRENGMHIAAGLQCVQELFSQIAAAFGQRIAPCGQCSACRRGPLTPEVPDFPREGPESTARWILTILQDAAPEQEKTD